jgi:hypothetical protein
MTEQAYVPNGSSGKRRWPSLVNKRTINIAGHATSISLEPAFMNALKEIAAAKTIRSTNWSRRSTRGVSREICHLRFAYLFLRTIETSARDQATARPFGNTRAGRVGRPRSWRTRVDS